MYVGVILTAKYGLQAHKTTLWAFKNLPSAASVQSTSVPFSKSVSNTLINVLWWLFHRRQNCWSSSILSFCCFYYCFCNRRRKMSFSTANLMSLSQFRNINSTMKKIYSQLFQFDEVKYRKRMSKRIKKKKTSYEVWRSHKYSCELSVRLYLCNVRFDLRMFNAEQPPRMHEETINIIRKHRKKYCRREATTTENKYNMTATYLK